MRDIEKTEITLKIGDRTATVTMDGIDYSGNDLVQAFYGLMVTQTFLPITVIQAMRDFADEHTEYCCGLGQDKDPDIEMDVE